MSSCGNRLEMETPVWCILIHVCVYRYMYIQIHQQHKDMALCVCVCVYTPVQFSLSVTSDSLQPHGWQLARPLCPLPTPGGSSNAHPLSRWHHPVISSSVVPFFSHLQSFSASGYFQWVNSLHQVAKLLEFQLQHQSFHWIFRTDFL